MGIKHTSEAVSTGHPDKVADHVTSYLLDRYIERDPHTRYAVETQIKDNFVTLGGEVTSSCAMTDDEIARHVRDAILEIGYTEAYAAKWGRENCIDPSLVEVAIHIGQQSPDIAQGVDAGGWGDQGIFWGMATGGADTEFMPTDHYLARELCLVLYNLAKDGGIEIGLDIKTQVAMDGDRVEQIVVAAPMMGDADKIEWIRKSVAGIAVDVCNADKDTEIVVNGTGAYVRHASQGDCGTTGRKLAVDFYGGNCRIGGGAPWSKDPSKADVSLNIYAREKAVEMLHKACADTVYCAISCCIGRRDIRIAYFDGHLNPLGDSVESRPASEIVAELGLRAPVFAWKNAHGLFTMPPTKAA